MTILNFLFINIFNLIVLLLNISNYKLFSLAFFVLAIIYNFTFSIKDIYIPFWIPISLIYSFFVYIKWLKNSRIYFISKEDMFLFYFIFLLLFVALLSLPNSLNMSMSTRYIFKLFFLIFIYFYLKEIILHLSYRMIRKLFFLIYGILVVSIIIQFFYIDTYIDLIKNGFLNFFISSNKQKYLLQNGLGYLIGHFDNIRMSLNFLTPHVLGVIFLFFSIFVFHECKHTLFRNILILLSLLVFLMIDSNTSTISFILVLLYDFSKGLWVYIPLLLIFIYKISFFIEHLSTIEQRFLLWDYAFSLSPPGVFGYGVNTAKILLENFNAFSFKLNKFHNFFIDLYIMVGPFGLGVFTTFLIIFYYKTNTKIRSQLLILLFVNMFDDFFFDEPSMTTIICFMIFIFYYIKKGIESDKKRNYYFT